MPLFSPPQRVPRSQWLGAALLSVSLVGILSACAPLKPPQEDLDPPPKVAATGVDAQDYLTKVDLARIKLGMNAAEVKNRIGSAMLGDPNPDRWDYVVKEGRGAAEQYNTWGVYFKDGRVVQIAQVQTAPVQNAQALGTPGQANTTAPDGLDALEPTSKIPNTPAAPKPAAKTKPEPKPEPKPEARAAAQAKQDPQPLAEPAVNPETEDPTAEISTTLRAWVAAWSGKKTNSYLSFYADNFKHGMASRSAWVAQRRARLSAPGSIALDLSNIQVTLTNPKQAEVKFIQRYKSDTYSDQGKKRMVLVRQGNAWKILEETFDK